MAKLDQIVDGTSIGDDKHKLLPEFFESPAFLFKIFESVLLIYAMMLEKTVEFNAGQAEHLTQLGRKVLA